MTRVAVTGGSARGGSGNALARARMEVAAGHEPVVVGLGPRATRALALAREVGAPVGPALAAAAGAQEDLEALRREVRVATAQARLVARSLVALPLVLVPGLDLLLGVPLLGFYATGAGRAVAIAAVALLGLGALVVRWSILGILRQAVATARPGGGPCRSRRGARPDDEVADLLAAALGAGIPTAQSLRAVGRTRPDLQPLLSRAALGLEHGRGPSLDGVRGAIAVADAVEVAATADALGVPAADALRDLAARQRAVHRAHLRARAEQLPTRLAVPSVLLFLPATVLLVGAPIVAAGLAST